MSRRALEVSSAVALWQAAGGSLAFMTFTMRHRKGQPLTSLWDALSAAWGRVTSGKSWIRDKGHHGIAGFLRLVEVTHGRNGWHVHVHCLVFIEPGSKPSAGSVRALQTSMFERWSSALRSRGLAAPLRIGQEAHLVTGPADAQLSEYFTKATSPAHALGLEFTASQSKKARSAFSTRSPWFLLDEVAEGDADALDLWHEWEAGSHRRRQMTWSGGLRRRLGLCVEESDEDIAATEVGTKADELLLITAAGWDELVRVPVRIAQLLDVAQSSGLSGARSVLDDWSIAYVLPHLEPTP